MIDGVNFRDYSLAKIITEKQQIAVFAAAQLLTVDLSGQLGRV